MVIYEVMSPGGYLPLPYILLTLYGRIKTAEQRPLYSHAMIGTLAIDGWLLHWVQRGRAWGLWAGFGPAQSPPRCIKCNSPLIQCTNFILFDVAL